MKYFIAILSLISLSFSLFTIDAFSEEPEIQYVIAKSGLWMRETPETTGKQVVLVPYNSKIKFIEQKNDFVKIGNISGKWKRIEYSGKTGWIFGGFISWKDANQTIPADLFGYWVKENTKQNSLEYFFDINLMSITMIYGRDATSNESWFIDSWQMENDAYVMEFTNNSNEKKRCKIVFDKKLKNLSIIEEGTSNITLIKKR